MSAALLEALDAERRANHLLKREKLRAIKRFEEIEDLVRRLKSRIAELEEKAKGMK